MADLVHEAPGPSRRAVILTAPEAHALRSVVLGEGYDTDALNAAIEVITDVIGEGRPE